MNGCTEGKGFYTDIITTGCISYDPYGHDTPEYSHAKVATMDKLRKEANEYHDPDRKRSIPRENAAQSEMYICRNCDWTGREPKVHTWNVEGSSWRDDGGQERHTPPHSGSMNKCPKCNKMVMTQKEWESDDFKSKWIPRIVLGVLSLGIIVIAFSF